MISKTWRNPMYWARGVNYNIKTAVAKLSLEQSAPTEETLIRAEWLLAYIYYHRQPVIKIRPVKIDIQAHSDASYLSENGSRSRYAFVIWIGQPISSTGNEYIPGIIMYDSGLIQNVVTSVGEAEYTGLFKCTMGVIKVRNFFEDMGYKLNTTVISVDSTCAKGLANRTSKDKNMKHIDMRLHFTREKVDDKTIHVEHIPTANNIADFGTKNMEKLPFQRKALNFLYSNHSHLKGELVTH
jgi:hypothetical protein